MKFSLGFSILLNLVVFTSSVQANSCTATIDSRSLDLTKDENLYVNGEETTVSSVKRYDFAIVDLDIGEKYFTEQWGANIHIEVSRVGERRVEGDEGREGERGGSYSSLSPALRAACRSPLCLFPKYVC